MEAHKKSKRHRHYNWLISSSLTPRRKHSSQNINNFHSTESKPTHDLWTFNLQYPHRILPSPL